jgi:hypothetical protein
MKISNAILITTLAIMATAATWHSFREHARAAGYRACMEAQPGQRRGITRLVFTNHQEWLAADNACKPY